MEILRTPDACFEGLPEFPFAPRYTEVDGLRIHHVEEGPEDGVPVLMLHGEPTWSFLYRNVIPGVAAAGHRAIAPDLVGFGRSDKPARPDVYTFAAHVDWMKGWITTLDLNGVVLLCQDWGSLIGLRLVGEMPDRFAAVVVANGFLPTGDRAPGLAFKAWQAFARFSPVFPVGWIVQAGCRRRLGPDVRAAYEAPFPTSEHAVAARAFPRLVPTRPDDPAAEANRAAWAVLERFERPLLTAFGDRDPIFRGADKVLQKKVPGAAGQRHVTLPGGHFIQEDAPEALAEVVNDLVGRL